MISVYKIIHNHYDASVTLNFHFIKALLLEVINIKSMFILFVITLENTLSTSSKCVE